MTSRWYKTPQPFLLLIIDFYWRDVVPTNAARVAEIVTGTYNQALKYKVMITTNKGNTRVIADNLSTTQNNVIGCSNAELELATSTVKSLIIQ